MEHNVQKTVDIFCTLAIIRWFRALERKTIYKTTNTSCIWSLPTPLFPWIFPGGVHTSYFLQTPPLVWVVATRVTASWRYLFVLSGLITSLCPGPVASSGRAPPRLFNWSNIRDKNIQNYPRLTEEEEWWGAGWCLGLGRNNVNFSISIFTLLKVKYTK